MKREIPKAARFLLIYLADSSSNYDAKKVHLDNLYRMVAYCENAIDCRRAQQLQYFGESFNSQLCKQNARAVCDNCSSKVRSELLAEIERVQLVPGIICATNSSALSAAV